jgi:hypothetical protein
MLHGSFTHNIGLLGGKTGVSVFFYHYARYTGKKIYNLFADELIDEIYKEIHRDLSCSFRDGLCGIAWGIGYLIKNSFVEANADDVLEELDRRIVEWDVRQISDYSLQTGLMGIACYVIGRMENKKHGNICISENYISDLIQSLAKKQEYKKEIPLLINLLETIVNKERILLPYNPVFAIVDKIRYNADSIFEVPRSLGISNNGYAGIGLKLMEITKQ